jgi:HAD superfamily hydrolase (TIGR01509 family)
VHVLRLPRHLPLERLVALTLRPPLTGIEAITFDFGNTLLPVARADLRRAVRLTAERVAPRLGPYDVDVFLRTWAEERDRQFREEVPQLREVDLGDRFVRVVARLRGMRPPPATERWDQAAARTLSNEAEIAWAVAVYSAAFVEVMPQPQSVATVLDRLAARFTLAVVSNWPLAATVDRYLAAAGWDRHFSAVVVSQRVGTIKPSALIFEAAQQALGISEGRRIVHVGDDWAADVVGAKHAGWRAAYLDNGLTDSPLPSSTRNDDVVADVEIADLAELEDVIAR